MKNQNLIGLDPTKAIQLSEKLNVLLANYSLFYQNVRGYHWNIEGEQFFELHNKFEELYTDLQTKIDDIAERILAIGGNPNHKYTTYNLVAEIKESSEVSNGKKAVSEIIDAYQILLSLQREILVLTDDADDEGTNSLLSDYIRGQEKMVWMYSAYLK